jgi:hypothetical protein
MLPSRPLSGLMQSYAPRRPVHERLGAPPSATGHVAGADLPTRPEASPQKRHRRQALGALPMPRSPGKIKLKILGQWSVPSKLPCSPTARRIASLPLDRPGSPSLGVHVAAESTGMLTVEDGMAPSSLDETPFLLDPTALGP